MSRLKPRPTMIFDTQKFRPAMIVCDRFLLLPAGAGQSRLLGRRWLQIQNPYSSARRVIRAVVVLEDRAPGFQRAHYEGVAFKIILRMVQHFIRVPVVGEVRVASVHSNHGVKTVKRSLVANLT